MQHEHIVIITVVESNVFYEFKYLWNKLLVNTGFEKYCSAQRKSYDDKLDQTINSLFGYQDTAINKSYSLNITKSKINICFIQSSMPPVTTTEHETTLDLESIKISWERTQFPFRTHDFQLVMCLKSPTE